MVYQNSISPSPDDSKWFLVIKQMHKLPFVIRLIFVVSRRCIQWYPLHQIHFESDCRFSANYIFFSNTLHIWLSDLPSATNLHLLIPWYEGNHSGFESDFPIFIHSFQHQKRYSILVTLSLFIVRDVDLWFLVRFQWN